MLFERNYPMLSKLYHAFLSKWRFHLPSVYNFAFPRRRLIKYFISGGASAAVDLIILYILTDILGIWYLLSSIVAFAVAIGVSFTLQKFWTFRNLTTSRLYQQAALYLLIGVINLLLNSGLMYILVEVVLLWYILAQVIAALVIAALSFFVYKNFIFHEASRLDSKS